MLRRDFDYHLPEALIALRPLAARSASRLLILDTPPSPLQDADFCGLYDRLCAGDLLVFNNTRVIPARLFGYKSTGGKVEVLIEQLIDEYQAWVHIKASKALKPGQSIHLSDTITLRVLDRANDLFRVQLEASLPFLQVLDELGHMPLPPYINRSDDGDDQTRYQTVYGVHPGAVAAPTAGLHFDEHLLERLRAKGVEFGFVTLHVGAGTFQPVRVDDIAHHQMHSEWMQVDASLCEHIQRTKARGNRVVAVGTTSVRCLETASQSGCLQPFTGATQIFIYPGYAFKTVDAMVTNFHLPESTLLMLVAAFAGYQRIMSAYSHAIEQAYRFYSYGDAMWIARNPASGEDLPPSA